MMDYFRSFTNCSSSNIHVHDGCMYSDYLTQATSERIEVGYEKEKSRSVIKEFSSFIGLLSQATSG